MGGTFITAAISLSVREAMDALYAIPNRPYVREGHSLSIGCELSI